jgi:hypothetical protein
LVHRRGYWILALGLLAATYLWRSAVARVPIPAAPAIALPTQPPLADKPVHMHYRGVPLAKVFDDLSRQVGAPFTVDWDSLQTAGYGRDEILVKQPDVEGAVSFSAALAVLSKGEIVADCAADPVFISTRDGVNAPSRAVTVVYPVRDLLQVNTPWRYADRPEALEELMKLTVSPDCWRDAGSQTGLIRRFNGTLIISATPGMHYQIRQLLAALRQQ